MLLHAFVPASRANGPGLRALVYFQGCTLNCAGCWNQQTHWFGGPEVTVAGVVRLVRDSNRGEDLEGVTFSGGEPMQQATALAEVMTGIRKVAPTLSLGMFTGYSEDELVAGDYFTRPSSSTERRHEMWHGIRTLLDFAVMGRYIRALPASEPLRTSRNQRLVLFNDRYRESDFEPQIVEINITAAGKTVVTGFPVLGIPA